MKSFSVFVYGTLKRGYRNHATYCAEAVDIAPAWLWGRLYQLDGVDYPGLELPPGAALAQGTINPETDAQIQAQTNESPLVFEKPEGAWTRVQGELIRFPDAARNLPPLDLLEEYRPDDEQSLYRRDLVPVEAGTNWVAAWTYSLCAPAKGVLLPNGVWPTLYRGTDEGPSSV